MLATISNVAGSAALQGNQTYAPYGSKRYSSGSMGTSKGYTGQYQDTLTGLDYYNARYYDPVAGIFLSADTAQGDMQGMDPFAYVAGNPETMSDPTGNYYIGYHGGDFWGNGRDMEVAYFLPNHTIYTSTSYYQGRWWQDDITRAGGVYYDPRADKNNSTSAKIGRATGWTDAHAVWSNPQATWQDKVMAGVNLAWKNVQNAAMVASILGGGLEDAGVMAGESGVEDAIGGVEEACAGGLSFTPNTPVATEQGAQAIGTMQVGEQVWAYNPKTKQMELQPVKHVWINHDDDLVDLTISTPKQEGKESHTSKQSSEVLHTNKKHPFLTTEQGFVPVGQLKLGMHIVRADGRVGVATRWKVVLGIKTMYNLEVAQDHTFTVGVGHWVVHNCALPFQPDEVRSLIKENKALVREAETMGKNQAVQREADNLIQRLLQGGDPGMPQKNLFKDISYLRGRNGARVFYRISDGTLEILGKASKSNEQRVIDILTQMYGP